MPIEVFTFIICIILSLAVSVLIYKAVMELNRQNELNTKLKNELKNEKKEITYEDDDYWGLRKRTVVVEEMSDQSLINVRTGYKTMLKNLQLKIDELNKQIDEKELDYKLTDDELKINYEKFLLFNELEKAVEYKNEVYESLEVVEAEMKRRMYDKKGEE